MGLDEDHNFLTEFQCFIRSDFIEVFHASQQDVIVRSTSKSVRLGQIGIRCRYCAHLPPGSKASRSSVPTANIVGDWIDIAAKNYCYLLVMDSYYLSKNAGKIPQSAAVM